MFGQHLAELALQAEANQETWSGYTRTPAEHLLILVEEVGEIAEAMQKCPQALNGYEWPPAYSPEVYEELVDAGAVILAMMRDCAAAS